MVLLLKGKIVKHWLETTRKIPNGLTDKSTQVILCTLTLPAYLQLAKFCNTSPKKQEA